MQSTSVTPVLRILHFNDCYDIQPNPKTDEAGIYYFKEHLKQHHNKNTITLFSGDAFSPSVLSTLFEGQQMVHCLNELSIDVACYGNHEFDFEIDHTIKLAKKCNFPWLLGNLIDKRTLMPLGDALQHVILEKNNLKIGIFGVAQQEWLQLLTQQYQNELQYIDYVRYGQYKLDQLKYELKCDLVIALAHMRVPNDRRLATEVPELDFVLGGHDHIIFKQVIGNVIALKSGSNFYNYSVIDIFPKSRKCQFTGHKFNYEIALNKVNPTKQFDQELKKYVDQKLETFNKQNDRIVGYTAVPLETRFSQIRSRQTNYANFVTDLVRSFYNCDVVMLNSGGVRIDQVIPIGPLKFSTIVNIFDDFLVIKLVPGKIIIEALENSCSKYPALQGRFLMVSGLKYTFDASKPPFSRVVRDEVYIKNQKIDLDKIYKVALHSYTAKGGDGYTMLDTCKYSVTVENAIRMIALLTRFYRPSSLNQKNMDLLNTPLTLTKKKSSSMDRMAELIKSLIQVEDRYFYQIQPVVEGRINILNA